MKFKLMATTMAFLSTLFNWGEKTPIVDGKMALSYAESKQLEEKLGPETAAQILEAINKEIAQVAKNEQNNADLTAANEELEKVKAEVAKMLKGTNLTEKEQQEIVAGTGQGPPELMAQLKAVQKAQKDQAAVIAKMMREPEGDAPIDTIKRNATNMKHSATHLFASGHDYDAFESRPWNQRLRDGGYKATDFNSDGAIPLLEKDAEHFVRQNPEAMESLFKELVDLPSQWARREGVLDIISSAAIIPGEIVQGRKKGWAPKNKFKIAPEAGMVFPKKIDITFSGYELQQMETTWVGTIYNKEGSHPWKMSFIGFLLSELMKQQKLDSRIAQIKGVFAQTPEGDDLAGANINSQDGLLYTYWLKRDVQKKYRAFSSSYGEPSATNIVDYVKEMIESIPEEYRREQGLELQLSYQLLQWYREKAGLIYSLHYEDQGKQTYSKNHPIDYENINFQPLLDFSGTKFMAITYSKNVEVMNYRSGEKNKFTFTMDKRDINIFADFREGIRLIYVGTKLADGEPKAFEKQVVWSNDVPVFDATMKVPVFDDKTGIVKYHFNNMVVDDAFVTDIIQFADVPTGQIFKITGNTSLAGAKVVKSNSNNVLTADFNLQAGGTLVLMATAEGKVKELSRSTAPTPVEDAGEDFEGTSIDANTGSKFNFTGAASATLTEILNGVDGKEISIYGTDTATVNFTVSDIAGNVAVASDAVLASAEDFITLVRIDGVWTETARTIAA